MTTFRNRIAAARRRAVGGHAHRAKSHIDARFAWGDKVAGQGQTTEPFTGIGSTAQRQYQAAVVHATAKAFDLIRDRSPVDTGEYVRSHTIMVNGRPVASWPVPLRADDDVLIRPDVPYAQFLEEGRSPQAPDGVYETVVATLDREYPGLAVSLTYDEESDGEPVPAIHIARASQ